MQWSFTQSGGHHFGATKLAGDAVERLDTVFAIDRHSDAHFEKAIDLTQQLAREYPAAGWLAQIIVATLREGLRLDDIEAEHAGFAKLSAQQAGAEGRAGAAVCESAAALFVAAGVEG